MNINVVGAGPAGLYFAIDTKLGIPSADITIFEMGPARAEHGLGYVLQKSMLQDLYSIDRNVAGALESETTGIWSKAEIEAKGYILGVRFPDSIGIRRGTLVSYLAQLAQNLGITIKYDAQISTEDVNHLRKDSDLLVGADGIHGVVREAYKDKLGAYTIDGTNSYIWLACDRARDLMRVIISGYGKSAFVATTYPIDSETESVIIEGSNDSLIEAELAEESKGRLSVTDIGLERLTEIFTTPFSHLKLMPNGSYWVQTKLNSCRQVSFDNVALLGESSISTHYSTGAGLVSAFNTSKKLAELLKSSSGPVEAAESYNTEMIGWLKYAQEVSLQSMRWLESIDDYYATLEAVALVHAFRMRV